MADLKVSLDERPEATVLRLHGSATAMNVAPLSRQATVLSAKRPAKLVIDMSELEFISSLPIGELISMARAVKLHKGQVMIAGASPAVREVLSHVRLQEVMPMYDTVDDAIAA